MADFPVRRAQIERVPLGDLGGRVLARAVVAAEDVPSFDRSMVDGFAVSNAEIGRATRQAPVRLRVCGEVLMGKAAAAMLEPGCAIAVPTGGALPKGTTGVVKIEDTQVDGDSVLVFDGTDSAHRINPARSDVAAGDPLFSAGHVLDPPSLGLLAAAGVDAVEVYVPPRIGLLVTGDELVSPGAKIAPGQIRESNGITIGAALVALGFASQRYERVPDDRATFAGALDRALRECDGVLISGGSSVGARDFTPELVSEAGSPGIIVHGVRVRPGRPVLLAMIGDQPVIGLPGNPVSALVMFEALAKPILLRMFDKRESLLSLRARLTRNIEVELGLEHRIPVQLSASAEGLEARPLIGTSSQLHILAFADAIVVVPEGTTLVPAGSWIDALPFTRSGTLR
jgi:molybdopterin molybdotransferase